VAQRERPRTVRTALFLARFLAPLALHACGAGKGSPTSPATPAADLYTVVAVVFYDENGNGTLDAGERARIPDAVVEVAGRTGRSEKLTGRTEIAGVPAGNHAVSVRADSLPPFYTPARTALLQVPQAAGADAMVGATLEVAANRPGIYMAFGDSITEGDGSSDGLGYRARLEAKLQAHFGTASVVMDAVGGTNSSVGALRIASGLRRLRPAYTLIHYGTNDWNSGPCQDVVQGCFTIPALGSMLVEARAAGSLPCLATIIPTNTGYDSRTPPSRNVWVSQINQQVRALARAQGALLVDLEAAFLMQGSLSGLFVDHVHPNDRGYEIMATTFFEAIAHGRVGSLAAPGLGWDR
jgi:lysophospholipase L1-like esterase